MNNSEKIFQNLMIQFKKQKIWTIFLNIVFETFILKEDILPAGVNFLPLMNIVNIINKIIFNDKSLQKSFI